MRRLQLRMTIISALFISPGLFLLVGCSIFANRPVSPFPAQKPENAAVTINFNKKGQFFITGSRGEPLSSKLVPFVELVKYVDPEDPEGLADLGSYTLYQAKEDCGIWLCKNNSKCFVGTPEGRSKAAVFSINFNGDTLFIGDALGKEVPAGRLIPISALAKEAVGGSEAKGVKSKIGSSVKALGTYKFYRLKGSIKVVICTPNHICSCTCIDTSQPWPWPTTECIDGNCPS
jgi:hypothetical protein